jgi:murein endopeptidase
MTGTLLAAVAGLWLWQGPMWAGAIPAAAVSPSPSAAVTMASVNSPADLLSLSDTQLFEVIQTNPHVLGPLSIGGPGGGRLFNAVAMPDGPLWEIGSNAQTWTTTETIASLESGVEVVNELFPATPPIRVGDFSDVDGGRLKRHKSHQCGRDVDVGFYLESGAPGGFVVGTARNLDLPRNWVLLRSWLVRTDVEVIFLDRRVQKLIYQYALGLGEDRYWLDQVFHGRGDAGHAIIQHVAGHRNHYHVRFYNPIAQELGRRAYPLLVQANLLSPPVHTVKHVVRQGQTLGHLASRYGTSVHAIMSANGLRSSSLRAGRAYRIPVRAAAVTEEVVVIPPRLLPPFTPPALEAITWPTAAVAAGGSGGDR